MLIKINIILETKTNLQSPRQFFHKISKVIKLYKIMLKNKMIRNIKLLNLTLKLFEKKLQDMLIIINNM